MSPYTIAADDRALHYGDGLFESMRWSAGVAPFWDWHCERLALGCVRLRLPVPDCDELLHRCRAEARLGEQVLVKLVWTAGSGPRGYARPPMPVPRALLQANVFEPRPSDLRLRWCELKLARQPALAGIKHLNRLEQVLARNEWGTNDFDEGLMLDSENQVICATAANVFIRVAGQWLTPPVDTSGVAGIARRWMLARGATVGSLSVADVENAEQCVLTNAVRGPRAAIALGGRRFVPDAEVRFLQSDWEQCFSPVGLKSVRTRTGPTSP